MVALAGFCRSTVGSERGDAAVVLTLVANSHDTSNNRDQNALVVAQNDLEIPPGIALTHKRGEPAVTGVPWRESLPSDASRTPPPPAKAFDFVPALLMCLGVGAFMVYLFGYEWWTPQRVRSLKNPEAVKALFKMYDGKHGKRYWAAVRLRELAESDPALREDIAQFARKAISPLLTGGENRPINELDQLLRVLETAQPAWEAQFLESVASSQAERWVRTRALERIAELRGADALTILLQSLDDPKLAASAARVIASLGPSAATPQTADRLRRLISDTLDRITASNAAQALIAIGHGKDPVFATDSAKILQWTQFAISLKASDIDADGLVELLFTTGLIGEDRRGEIGDESLALRYAVDREGAFSAMVAFLVETRSAANFDAESATVPPDYNDLIAELTEIASPRLDITDAVFDESQMTLTLQLFGRTVTIVPKFMGDWFDVEAVLAGLNEAIIAAGRSERFVDLTTGGQDACVVLGDAEGIDRPINDFHLPVEGRLDASLY
jgi:hypothetical protein